MKPENRTHLPKLSYVCKLVSVQVTFFLFEVSECPLPRQMSHGWSGVRWIKIDSHLQAIQCRTYIYGKEAEQEL